MCKKSLLSLMLLCFAFVGLARAEVVEIGNPEATTTQYTVPVNMFYNYSLTQQIFPACEIGTAGTINSIAFEYTNSSSFTMSGVQVYMMLTDKDNFETTTDMVPLTNATLVWEGTFAADAAGWVTLELTTPFVLDGANNLLVCCYDPTNGYPGSAYKFRTTSTTTDYPNKYLALAYYSDSYTPSLSDVSTFSGSKSRNQYRNNIRLDITPDPSVTLCCPVDAVTVPTEGITAHEAVVNWEGGTAPYTVEYKKTTDTEWTVGATGINGLTTTLTGLTQNTAYQARVQSGCGSAWVTSANFTTLISVQTPTDLTCTATTLNSATLGWTENGTATSWVVAYKASTEENFTEVTVNTNPYTITGLTPSTSYTAKVCAVGNGENSSWSSTISFNTMFAVPINETFATTSVPAGWNRYTGLLGSVLADTLNLAPYNGGWSFSTSNGVFDNHARVNIYGTGCKYWLVTPNLTMENNVQLSFDLALTAYSGTLGAPATTGTDDKFVVLIATIGADTTWTVLRQWDNAGSEYVYNNINATAVGENVTIDLSSYAGQNIAIAFYGESTVSNADNNLHIDNVSIDYIPNCPKPTGLAATNPYGHGATLSWTSEATEWVVAYKNAADEDFTEITGVTENPYTIAGLDPETAYNVKVRANCGGTLSEWSNTANFTTTVACPAPSGLAATLTPGNGTIALLTWTENGTATEWDIEYGTDATFDEFITTNASGTPSVELTGLTPETTYYARVKTYCGDDGYSIYSNILTFTPTDAYMLTVNDGTNTNGYVPVYGTWVDGTVCSQFIIPADDLAVMTYGTITQMTFYANTNKTWDGAEFEVYMAEVDYTTLSELVNWTAMTKVMNAAHLEISNNTMVVSLDNPYQYFGGNLMIGVLETTSGTWGSSYFYGISATGASIGGQTSSLSQQNFLPKTTFDYIPGEEPDCLKPTGLAVNYEGGTTATVTWNGEATSYNIEVNGTVTEGVTSPYSLTGLDMATTYEVRVQADCGSGMLSDWTNAVRFTTDLCMPENQCELTFVLTDSYGDSWNGNAIVVTDVETGEVIATLANQDLDGTTGEETQTVTLTVCDGRELQFSWTTGSYIGEVSYTVTDVNGEVIVEGSGAGFETFNYIVSCLVTNCRKPTNLAVSEIGGHSAVLSWTENGEATEWVVEVADLASGQITVWNTTTNPYTIVGLSPETEHSVKVRPVCTDLDNLWSEKIIFTTDVACPAPMQLNITDITSNSAVVNWGGEGESFDLRIGTIAEQVELRNTLTYDFEDSDMQGWTNIDADGDGYEWVLGSLAGGVYLAEGGSLAGSGHEESTADFVTSGSYSNYTGGALTPDNYLVSPAIVLGGSISFWACAQDASYAAEHFGVAVSTTSNTDPTAFTTIQEWTIGGRSQSDWVLYTVDLSAYSGVGYVAIRHFDCTDMFMLDVDDIAIEEGFLGEIEWSEPITGVTSPYQLTDLTPETYYFVQVRANCGDEGYSEWAQVGFTTKGLCDVPTNLTTTDIDAYTATLNWNGAQERYNLQYRTTSHRNPIYFTNFNTDEARQGWTWTGYVIHGYADPIYNINGDNNYFLQMGWGTTEEAYIFSPELPEYEEGSTLEFYYFGYNTQNTFQVGYSSTTSDIDAFTWSEPIDAPLAQYTLYSEVLPAGIKYVAFKATASEQNATVFIDNFGIFRNDTPAGEWITTSARGNTLTIEGLTPETEYEWQVQGINPTCDGGVTEWSDMVTFTTTPSCLVPTDLAVSDVTSNSAVLSWTSTATLFDIKVNDELIEGVTTPYTLENLDPQTIYYVYVRANCGDGDYSDWTDFIAFVTDCGGAKDLPYAYDFEDQGEYYACWAASSFNTSNNVGLTTIDNSTVFRFSSYSSATDYRQILVSPELNTENAVVVSFDYRTSNTSAETFQVGYATGDYTSIEDFTFGEAISVNNNTEWATYTETLPAGTKYVAVLYSSSYQYYLYVDNFIFDEPAPGITQTTELSEGWNWVSTYIDAEDPVAMLDMLKESLGENGLRIESAYYTTEFDGEEWFGDLDDEGINNVEMYLIEVSTDCAIELQGMPANPANHSITIEPGYTWIGFPCAEEVEIAVALADFEAEEGDQIESAEGLTEFDGEEWFGDIETLVPGQGYLYYSASEDTKTLVFLTMTRRADANSRRLFDTMVDRIRPVNCKVINK